MAASPKAEQRKTKPPPPPVEEEHATVPVRVSPTVHQFIITKANWGESIDRTLRRLLKIPEGAKKSANGK
jgi:hypothetical protein